MPRGIHSKLFGIVWINCGLIIIALVISFITTSLTMNVIKSDIAVYGSKVKQIFEFLYFKTSSFLPPINFASKMNNHLRPNILRGLRFNQNCQFPPRLLSGSLSKNLFLQVYTLLIWSSFLRFEGFRHC